MSKSAELKALQKALMDKRAALKAECAEVPMVSLEFRQLNRAVRALDVQVEDTGWAAMAAEDTENALARLRSAVDRLERIALSVNMGRGPEAVEAVVRGA